jgi:hypothetical protein
VTGRARTATLSSWGSGLSGPILNLQASKCVCVFRTPYRDIEEIKSFVGGVL